MHLPLHERAGNLRAMKKARNPTFTPAAGATDWPGMTRRARGFTLLELMIAVAVLAIMVGIGIPSFQDMMRRNRLAAQTNSFVGALAIARNEAVKRGVLVTVCPANDPVNQQSCGPGDDWATNGLIIFTDGFGSVGVVDADDEDDEENDAIIHRIPPGAVGISVRNDVDLNLISYRPDGGLNLPPGAETRFTIAPKGCKDPLGARSVQLITAGRVSTRKINCPIENEDD
jgi:type IV fimbrial biogenesis protein FimT